MKPTEAQLRRLHAIASSRGWTREGLKTLLEMNFRARSSSELTIEQYNEVCEFLERSRATNVATMKRDKNTPDLFDDRGDPYYPKNT